MAQRSGRLLDVSRLGGGDLARDGEDAADIELFSNKTGVNYPFAKYDQLNAPDYIFGGMENVTATTQPDDDILHPAWAEPQATPTADLARARAPVVRRLPHHPRLGARLAERGVRHLHGADLAASSTCGVDEGARDRMGAQEQTIGADRGARRPLVFNRWVTDPLELFFSGHIYPKGATIPDDAPPARRLALLARR